MSEEQTRSVLLVVLGATAVWLWWSGEALNYVRPGLAPFLLAGGVVVVLLGLLPPLGLLGEQAAGHADGHRHKARVGWLLLVPVLVVMLVQPAALGSYAVSSRSVVPEVAATTVPAAGRPGPRRGPDADGRVRHPRGPRPRPVACRGAGAAGRVRRPRRGRRWLPADPLRHLLLRRRRRSPPGRRAWRPDPPRPGPVAGGRGNLVSPPGRRRRPQPTPPVLHADVVRPVAPPRPPYEYSVQFSG